jgi:hypothetical protein
MQWIEVTCNVPQHKILNYGLIFLQPLLFPTVVFNLRRYVPDDCAGVYHVLGDNLVLGQILHANARWLSGHRPRRMAPNRVSSDALAV